MRLTKQRTPQVGDVRGYPDASNLRYIERVEGGYVQYKFVGWTKSFTESIKNYEYYRYYGRKAPLWRRLLFGKVYM